MTKFIPLISSGTAGPLGVLHLPRLWLKASLGAAGKLHPDYPAIGQGFDRMVLEGLGIDRTDFQDFIATAKPTYPQLEAWILDQSGGSLDGAAVDKLNSEMAAAIHGDALRTSILAANGLHDDGQIMEAIPLNNLDDWLLFHHEVIVQP